MLFLIFVGALSLIFGILFLFRPQVIRDLNEKTNKSLNSLCFSFDEKAYNLRIGLGISLILVSVLAFFVVYYLIKI